MEFILKFEEFWKDLKEKKPDMTEKECALQCYEHGLRVVSNFKPVVKDYSDCIYLDVISGTKMCHKAGNGLQANRRGRCAIEGIGDICYQYES